MRVKLGIFLYFAFFLNGCGTGRHVTVSDQLNWYPSRLSMDECPDLSGRYVYDVIRHANGGISIKLIPFYSGSMLDMNKIGIKNIHENSKSSNNSERLPDFQTYYYNSSEKSKKKYASGNPEEVTHEILRLTQTSSLLVQENFDVASVQRITKLGTVAAGCNGGSLILRYVENYGGREFVPRSISYGEFELRKTPDGSLMVTRRERRAQISSATGMLIESKEFPSLTAIYPLAKP